MNFFKYTFVLLFSFLFLFTNAQDANIEWVESDREWPREFYNRKYVTTLKKMTYCYAQADKGKKSGIEQIPYLEVYNEDGEFVKRAEILRDIDREYLDIFEFMKKIYIVTSVYDEDKRKRSLFMHEVNTEFMRTEGKEKRVGTVSVESESDEVIFLRDVSPDNVHIAFGIGSTNPVSKRSTRIRVYMFKAEGGRLRRGYSKSGKLDFPAPVLMLEDIAVNDNGDIFALLTHQGVLQFPEETEPVTAMAVTAFTYNGDTIKNFIPEVAGKNILQGFITPNKFEAGNGFSVTGFFREGDDSKVDGVVNLIYDKNGNMQKSEQLPLNYTLPDDLQEETAESKEEKNWKTLGTKKSNLRDGFYLISELYYNPGTEKGPSEEHKYYDLLIASVAPEGNLRWTNTVAKRQITNEDDGHYSSYLPLVVKHRLVLLFNDVFPNFEIKDNTQLTDFTGIEAADAMGNSMVRVTINKEGEYVKKHLMVDGTAIGIMIPGLSNSDDYGNAQFHVRDKDFKTFRIGRINFAEGYVD